MIADLVAEEQRRNPERRGRRLGEPEKLQDSSPVLSELKLKEIQLQEREAALKEDWKQKPSIPPTLTKAPSLTDLVKSGPGKAKEPGADPAKSVIIPKLDDSSKLPSQAPEGLKVKLSEASHLGKEASEAKTGADCGRQAEVDPILWYRQVTVLEGNGNTVG